MTGFAIAFQSTFYHTACQLGAIGNAKIHTPATDRRMAVRGIAHQKDPADPILGDLPNGYFEFARASNVCDIQFQRKGTQRIRSIGNDPKSIGFKRRHHDHITPT